MTSDIISSSSSKSASSVSQKDLLNFYQKKYEEGQRKEDKYKEKVDKHIKNLVTDRYELEEEVLRRGEKIADLQKALVELQLSVFEERERFLKVSSENEELQRNKEQLHENIRQLLLMTNQQNLRDRIIYILQEPKVDIVSRTDITAKSGPAQDMIANQKLKEELDSVKRQLDEVLQISKSKSDIVLEDCKKALEKSKKKIMQDELVIKQLQKKLQESKDLERNKSSVAAAKSSSVERHQPVGKSILADRQNFLTTAKVNSYDGLNSVATTKNVFAERLPGGSVPVHKGISAERLNTEKNFSREFSYGVAVTNSTSEERPRSVPINRSIERQIFPTTATGFPNAMLHSVVATRTSSAERPITVNKTVSTDRQRSAKVAKSVSWENHPPVKTATESMYRENQSSRQYSTDSELFSNLCSLLKDIHLSFILLMKIVSKIKNIVHSIQTTKLYHRFAKIPNAPTDLQHHVEENDILQLESSLRQCTRLTFDINNMCQSVWKHINKSEIRSIQSELKYLEKTVKEMSIITADNDLLNVGLKRSNFFQALRDSSVVVPETNRLHYLDDFKKIVKNCEILSKNISEATDYVESVVEKYAVKKDFCDIADSLKGFSHLSSDRFVSKLDSNESLKQAKSKSLQDLKKLVNIYKRTVQDSENFGLSTEKLSERIKSAEKVLQEEEKELANSENNFDEIISQPEMSKVDEVPSNCEDILHNINKTLSKVELIKQGRYFKDEEVCRNLAENVSALTEKFRELTQDYNVKSFQNQFSEYSRVTLSKLEELAKQCRNSVIAAEAQIAAHRSNAKHLSEKLKETEELLRESINECLSLKQKFKQTEAEREMEKYRLISTLKDRLEKHSSHEVEEVINELVSNFPAYETIKTTPFICMYCRHGPGHKHCEEKIKELTAECRKFRTQLKLLKQDTDQEKLTLKNHNEVAESSLTDLRKRNEAMKLNLETLEKKNASLLEQLKLEKNRIKSMERHRRLEIEGFQTDIKLQKAQIKDLEKQLSKAILIFESNHKDIEMLKAVHETAERSVQAVGHLKRLKAKLYQLETDMKSL